MYKKAKIVMTPAIMPKNLKGMIMLCHKKPPLKYNVGDIEISTHNEIEMLEFFTPQHLYFLEKDTKEILPGQWYFDSKIQEPVLFMADTVFDIDTMSLILSSTNTHLILPKPSLLFLERYCKEDINEVEIEYINHKEDPMFSLLGKILNTDVPKDFNLPKLNNNFEVSIRPIKEEVVKEKTSWNKEEVEEMFDKCIKTTVIEVIDTLTKEFLK